jgi:hypothetical protein
MRFAGRDSSWRAIHQGLFGSGGMKFSRIIVVSLALVVAQIVSPVYAKDKAPAPVKPAPLNVSYRFLLKAYQGDPRNPGSLTFQIDIDEGRQPPQLLGLQGRIEDTPWILSDFKYKTELSPHTNRIEDISELTLFHSTKKTKTVIVVGRPITISMPAQ